MKNVLLRVHKFRAAFSLILFLLSYHSSWAGGGPAGFIVVYNPNDPRSVTIANYYQQVRNIPERNMVPYVMPGYGAGFVFTRTTAWDFVYSLRQTLAARGLTPQLQGIALAGVLPLSAAQVPPDNLGGWIYSIQSLLYLSPNYSQASFPATLEDTNLNPAYVPPSSFNGPSPAGTTALTASTLFSNQTMFASGQATVWPVSCIGIPGTMGNSVKEILSYIDRAKSHDGLKPAGGKIYWPLNGDIRSSVRQNEINDVASLWNARGISFIISGSPLVSGNYWVSNRTDIQGGIPGGMSWTDEGNTYLPGAWVDHMTSYGGVLDSYSFMSPQYTCAKWLRMGVDGTAGNVAEPQAIADKCPHANIHTHLRAGASQVEAFWESVKWPAEMFCLGDPLLQVFASFPVVTVSAPADGSIVSGTLAIGASAVPTGGKILETNLDLFIDGRLIGIGNPNEPVGGVRTMAGFSLDTTTLADGWHEFRVVAYNADSVRTQNEKQLSVIVNNLGQSLTLTGTNSVNPNGTASFTVTPSGLADLTSLVLQANGRVLATLPVTGGITNLSGSTAPLTGNWTVYAIGTRGNGQQVWSAPFTTAVSWPAMAPTNNPPLGNAMADVRVFNSTTNSNFNWDTPPPDVVTNFYGDSNSGLSLTTGNFSPFLAFKNVASTKPGLELKFWFYAPFDDWYEFGKTGDFTSYQLQLTVDGQTNAMLSTQVWGINHLAPGWHSVRLRSFGSAGGTQITVYVRGGASQDFVFCDPYSLSSTDTRNSPGTDAPTISLITPSSSPVTGTNVTLTVNATIGAGSSNELAGLKYIWTVLSAPSNTMYSPVMYNGAPTNKVSFSTNGGLSNGGNGGLSNGGNGGL